jgi:hypothetical protein
MVGGVDRVSAGFLAPSARVGTAPGDGCAAVAVPFASESGLEGSCPGVDVLAVLSGLTGTLKRDTPTSEETNHGAFGITSVVEVSSKF